MVARADAAVDHLKASDCIRLLPKNGKDDGGKYAMCLRDAGVMDPCDVIAHPDSKHLEDNCKVACRKDSCRCHDGPPCTHFGFDIGNWDGSGGTGLPQDPEMNP